MTLAEKLSTYDEKYWDFSEYRNDAPLVRYPAVMVAPMQACILKEIINADPTISTVLDPFCGSGTVLCEGQKLGLNVMGFDINPLAVLIATVQLEGIPEDCAVRSINAINTRLTMLNGNVKSYAFKNINKWFNDDIIVSLSVIRQAIIEETNERMRRFFWCCFAETVKKFSNTRTSTFKLHIKEQSKIEATVDDTITFFKEHIQNNYLKYVKDSTSSICIKCGDSKEHLAAMVADSVDLICTSPPYGDNHTTVTYGQFSILPLLWIDKKDLHIWDDTILETFTAIDSASLGGRVKRSRSASQALSGRCGPDGRGLLRGSWRPGGRNRRSYSRLYRAGVAASGLRRGGGWSGRLRIRAGARVQARGGSAWRFPAPFLKGPGCSVTPSSPART